MDEIGPTIADETTIIIEGNPARPTDEQAAAPITSTPDGDELTPLLGAPPVVLPAVIETGPPAADASADPEFDAYLAVVKLLIGGAIEGAAELVERLEKWETELNAAGDPPAVGEAHSGGDVARYMLVGMALSASDGLRRQVFRLAQASDMFWRFTGSATQPLVNNRLTGIVAGPIDRAFDQLVSRGQKRVDGWVELGRAQEPGARRMARKTFEEVIDEFIGLMAENEELANLVQKKSMGLATEAVDEFRSRTVSADAIAENIVRRILRRPARTELPGSLEDSRLEAGPE